MKKQLALALSAALLLSPLGAYGDATAGALAFTLPVEQRGDLNLFPLKDLCTSLGYGLAWDTAAGAAVVTTPGGKYWVTPGIPSVKGRLAPCCLHRGQKSSTAASM